MIDLIKSTVKPTSWDDVGGAGSISPFPTGVWVDPRGVLRPASPQPANEDLAALRAARPAAEPVRRTSAAVRRCAWSRCRGWRSACSCAWPPGSRRPKPCKCWPGLYRIRCVFIYPDSGDIVLAGPAGDWTPGPEGTILNAQTAQPVLRLDDLVVVFRSMMSGPDARFGCWIMPREENLARLQKFLEHSQKRPIDAEFRGAWLDRLRAEVGKQDIEVYGLDPRTRAARVIVAADYRMKLVGMGLEEGVPGVQSYLKSIKLAPGQPPPPMAVLRWWFTLNYEPPLCSRDRLAFALRGQGVKVESENEHLTAEGKQVHTGASEELNRRFARSFTEHFEELSRKYPIYGELRNLFELAMVGALIREEAAADKVGWHLTCFGDPQAFEVELADAPKEVDSVVNCRVINRKTIVAGVSGGVAVQPVALVRRQSIGVERDAALEKQRSGAGENNRKLPDGRWWWD